MRIQHISSLIKWLDTKGIAHRPHTNLLLNAIQVAYQGHWMGVIWNKHNRKYTVDKRLIPLLKGYEDTPLHHSKQVAPNPIGQLPETKQGDAPW